MPHTPRDRDQQAEPLNVSRRGLLGAGLGVGVGAGLGLAGPAHARSAPAVRTSRSARAGQAKNVIFMVVDGMSTSTLSLGEMYARANLGRSMRWCGLWGKPGVRRASMTTYAADGWVTDSAAAGSAWGIGEHINNDAVNWTPDGRTPAPLFVRARADGRGTGLVTTTRVTHATPASFINNVPKRSLENEIARQQLERGADLILGGGARHFPDELLAEHKDWTLVRTRDELLKAPAGADKLLGLFAKSHVDFDLDRRAKDEAKRDPSLAEMTDVALRRLEKKDRGFVVQIEGGRVDHGAHSNDLPAMLFDLLAFDDAIETVLRWLDGRDDTLLIITTDHGNANPALTVYGKPGAELFSRIPRFTRTLDWAISKVDEDFKGAPPAERVRALLGFTERAIGGELRPEDRDWVMRAASGQRVNGFDLNNSVPLALGAVVANMFGVAFLSPNHTADLVEVTALGPGSERLKPLIDNIELHTLVTSALALPKLPDIKLSRDVDPNAPVKPD
jgi:alkaline phosphatase